MQFPKFVIKQLQRTGSNKLATFRDFPAKFDVGLDLLQRCNFFRGEDAEPQTQFVGDEPIAKIMVKGVLHDFFYTKPSF